MNKTVQDLKVKIESMEKTQREIWKLKKKNLSGNLKRKKKSLANKKQEMRERISGIEDVIEEIDISLKGEKNLLTQNTRKSETLWKDHILK